MAGRIMKLTSPGRLVDPVIENATAAATSIAGGLRLRWRKFRNNGESYRAIKEVSKRVPGFKDEEFKDQAKAAFVKVTEAASTANLPELKRLCTPQYYSAVRRGLEATAASRSCVDGVHVKAFIGEPKVLQARLVYLTPQAMRTWTTPPEFAQITVRIETRQAPVTTTDSQALKRVRRKGGKGGKGGTGSAHADVGDQVWEQAFSDDGHPYYFTPDGFATWERPTQFGVVGIAPVHLRDTGAVREVMNTEDSADASDGDQAGSSGEPSSRGRKGNRRRQSSVAAEERVVNYAVFERALVPGGDQEWKLTHL